MFDVLRLVSLSGKYDWRDQMWMTSMSCGMIIINMVNYKDGRGICQVPIFRWILMTGERENDRQVTDDRALAVSFRSSREDERRDEDVRVS
jgi:hypothetical protein